MTLIRRMINAYKVMNLPWKSSRFVGKDLHGNMYFEGPSVREGLERTRRSIEYANGEVHVSQYNPNAIPVAWLAWLRHTRMDAPTVEELQQDQLRLARLREKVAVIEARDQERRQQELSASSTTTGSPQIDRPSPSTPADDKPIMNGMGTKPSNPSDDFEPESWTATPRKRS